MDLDASWPTPTWGSNEVTYWLTKAAPIREVAHHVPQARY